MYSSDAMPILIVLQAYLWENLLIRRDSSEVEPPEVGPENVDIAKILIVENKFSGREIGGGVVSSKYKGMLFFTCKMAIQQF